MKSFNDMNYDEQREHVCSTVGLTLDELLLETSRPSEQIALAQLFKNAHIRKQRFAEAAAFRDVEKRMKDAEVSSELQFQRRLQQATDEVIAAATQAINKKVAGLVLNVNITEVD